MKLKLQWAWNNAGKFGETGQSPATFATCKNRLVAFAEIQAWPSVRGNCLVTSRHRHLRALTSGELTLDRTLFSSIREFSRQTFVKENQHSHSLTLFQFVFPPISRKMKLMKCNDNSSWSEHFKNLDCHQIPWFKYVFSETSWQLCLIFSLEIFFVFFFFFFFYQEMVFFVEKSYFPLTNT